MVLFLPPYERNGRDMEIRPMAAAMELSGGQEEERRILHHDNGALSSVEYVTCMRWNSPPMKSPFTGNSISSQQCLAEDGWIYPF